MSNWLGDRHWQMLVDQMDKIYAARSEQIAQGFASDYPEYRERVGYLACMRDIKAWSDEIIKSMDARPPQARNDLQGGPDPRKNEWMRT